MEQQSRGIRGIVEAHLLQIVCACAALVLLLLLAVFGPALAAYNPILVDPLLIQSGPSHAHPCGTTALGSDVCSQVLSAYRYDLAQAGAALALALVVGAPIGALAALGGPLEAVLTPLIGTHPRLYRLFLPLLAGGLGQTIFAMLLYPAVPIPVLIFCFFTWPAYARLTRGAMQAARSGEESGRVRAWLLLLPAQVAIHAWAALLTVGWLGLDELATAEPAMEWGGQISSDLINGTGLTAWEIAYPALALVTAVLALGYVSRVVRTLLGQPPPPVWRILSLLRRSTPLLPVDASESPGAT